MTTLTKIIVATLLSLMLFSCNLDIKLNQSVKGNGDVTTEERGVTESFNSIKVSEGLNLVLQQSDNENIIVEADDNLHELIITEVINGVLKIHTSENIRQATSKKVIVTFTNLSKISASSGSYVKTNHFISTNHLELNSYSGSYMKLKVNASTLHCKSSSGSSLHLTGESEKFTVNASSGSNIKAGNLKSEFSEIKASSGANIIINTSKELIAKASSGANIKYYGNPKKVKKNKNSSGNVSKG